MKKTSLFILLLCSMFLFTGCWSRVEIEDRGIIAAMGIDKAAEKDKVEVTVQIIKPGEIATARGGGGGSEEAVAVYTDTGYDVFDALRNLTKKTGRKIFLSEMAVLVIGENMAREGIGSAIDFMRRDAEPNIRTYILVARGRAKEVLETKIPTERVWGFGLMKMVKAIEAHSKATKADILDFQKAIISKTTCPVATGIETAGMEREPVKEAVAPGKEPVLAGTAVFKGYRLTGWLDEVETRGMLWVKGEVKSGIIVIHSPEDETKPIAIEIIRADSEIKPQISDDRINVTVKIKEEGNIGEVRPNHLKITKPGVIQTLEARQSEAIKREVLTAVNKAQELNTDIFGFGDAVRRRYPVDWQQMEKRWDELFPLLDVQVEVDAKIRRTGMITDPEQGY